MALGVMMQMKTQAEIDDLAAILLGRAGSVREKRAAWLRREAPALRALADGSWSWIDLARAVSQAGLGYGPAGQINRGTLERKVWITLHRPAPAPRISRRRKRQGASGDDPGAGLPVAEIKDRHVVGAAGDSATTGTPATPVSLEVLEDIVTRVVTTVLGRHLPLGGVPDPALSQIQSPSGSRPLAASSQPAQPAPVPAQRVPVRVHGADDDASPPTLGPLNMKVMENRQRVMDILSADRRNRKSK